MPPKKQITKDMILEKAFELTRAYGYDTITTRSLAKELACSTQPIYQAFSDMQELKQEVMKKAFLLMQQFIFNNRVNSLPEDLSLILGYIKYAITEKKLFQLLAVSGNCFSNRESGSSNSQMKSMDEKMIIFANGIIMMTAFSTMNDCWEDIQRITIEAYHCFHDAKKNDEKIQ